MKKIFTAFCTLLLLPTLARRIDFNRRADAGSAGSMDGRNRREWENNPHRRYDLCAGGGNAAGYQSNERKTVENTEALFKKEGTKYNEMDCYNRSRHKKENRS